VPWNLSLCTILSLSVRITRSCRAVLSSHILSSIPPLNHFPTDILLFSIQVFCPSAFKFSCFHSFHHVSPCTLSSIIFLLHFSQYYLHLLLCVSLLSVYFFIPNVCLFMFYQKSALSPICDFHLFPCWNVISTFLCAVPILKEKFLEKYYW
jgi:hypothetical protein